MQNQCSAREQCERCLNGSVSLSGVKINVKSVLKPVKCQSENLLLKTTLSGGRVGRCGRYVLIIHFYVESGQKLIQFNIQFKIESKIFIQKIIHSNWKNKFKKLFNSKLNQKYSFKLEK